MLRRVVVIAVLALVAQGCEKPTHENIEKWASTKKGPGKLRSTLLDDGLDPDLSAHAAAVMIKTGRDGEVKTELDHMSEQRRTTVVAKLAPRLWEIARIEGEMLRPAAHQIQAKDAMFVIRKHADAATRTQIDGYLIDWYAVPSFEGRANAGAFSGAVVMRAIGLPAAKKMMGVLAGIVTAPGQETTKKRIGDELMLAVAATGDPEAVKYLLDVARMDRGDPTLSMRAMSALYRAYVDSERLVDVQDPETAAKALGPNLDTLAKIVTDDQMNPKAGTIAAALIRSVGPPACLPPLISMIPHPHANAQFRYLAPDYALKCGGTKAIKDVVRAMPDQAYGQAQLAGTVVLAISDMEPRDQVLAALRDLLGDKSRVARWVAIETLTAMKSVEDASKIASVKGGGEKLIGYWGDGASKPEPTLGQRAKELSGQLTKPSK